MEGAGIGRYEGLALPIIKPDQVLVSGGKGLGAATTVERLIFQSIIATFIFLIIIVWFTLCLNLSTRAGTDTDYLLFQFAVYFTVIAIIIIMLLVTIIIHRG